MLCALENYGQEKLKFRTHSLFWCFQPSTLFFKIFLLFHFILKYSVFQSLTLLINFTFRESNSKKRTKIISLQERLFWVICLGAFRFPLTIVSKRRPLQDEHHYESDPPWFFYSFYLNSGMSPQHVRGELGLLGSKKPKKSRQGTKDTVVRPPDVPRPFLFRATFSLLWHLNDITLPDFSEHLCTALLSSWDVSPDSLCWWPLLFL